MYTDVPEKKMAAAVGGKKKKGAAAGGKKKAVGGTKKKRRVGQKSEEGSKANRDAQLKALDNGSSNLRKPKKARLIGSMQFRLVDVMGQSTTNRRMSQKYHARADGKVATDGLEGGVVVYGKAAMANLCDAIGLDGWKKLEGDDDDKKGRYVRDKLCKPVKQGMGFEEDVATRGDGRNVKYWKFIPNDAEFVFHRMSNAQTALFIKEVERSRGWLQDANANANEAEADEDEESGNESVDSAALGAAK